MALHLRRLLATSAAAALLLCSEAEAGKPLGGGWEEKKKDDGKVVQQLKIEAPTMTEEDQYGYTMPDRYRCDACKAVMFHLDAALQKQQPKSRRLKDWEYTDIFDEACRSSFSGYGIKLINGENALSGPGLPRSAELAPGSGAIQMSSENWSKRLMETCRKLVYEKIGEDETYDKFWAKFSSEEKGEVSQSLGLSADFCQQELSDCRAPKKAVEPKAAKEKKDKADKQKEKKDSKEKKDTKDSKDKKNKKEKTKKTEASTASAEEKVDSATFLRNLAVKHGLTSDEYAASRTSAEWEKLVVSIAGKLFSQKSEL